MGSQSQRDHPRKQSTISHYLKVFKGKEEVHSILLCFRNKMPIAKSIERRYTVNAVFSSIRCPFSCSHTNQDPETTSQSGAFVKPHDERLST